MQPPKTETARSKSVRATKKTDDNGILSPGSRASEIGSLPIKMLSFNTSTPRETDAPRKPFTQITPGNSIPSTPVRPICEGTEGENRTPKTLAAPTKKTPMKVSAPMQMATTPALTATKTSVSLAHDKPELTLQRDVEYSFEERRLAAYGAAQVA
uniref:Uncharacterized protein n=1 Tax=Arundo donax TaxID=35708 RepID=A0A0A9FWN3_ARUDO